MKNFPAGKFEQLALMSCILLGSFGLGGCSTRVHEVHEFQVKSATNDQVSYYRIVIDAQADLAKTKLKAGFYPAAVVDRLLGDVGKLDEERYGPEFASQTRAAISELGALWIQAMKDGNVALAEKHRKSIRNLSIGPESSALLQESEEAGDEREKFVIIFSSNATVIETAIADYIEGSKSTEQLVGVLMQRDVEQLVMSSVELQSAIALAEVQVETDLNKVSADRQAALRALVEGGVP